MRIRRLHISGVAIAVTVALHAHSASAFQEWQEQAAPACAQSIAASDAGVWIVGCNNGIGNDSAVYWRNSSGSFQRVTSSFAVATQVGVSVNGHVWIINKAGSIREVESPKANGTSDLTAVFYGTATQNGIAVDANNDVYIRALDDNAWEWNGSAWSSLGAPGGPANWISFFDASTTFGEITEVTQSGFFWQGGVLGWTQLAGGSGTLLANHMTLAGTKLFYYNDATNVWTQDTIALPVAASSVRGIANEYDPTLKIGLPWLIDTSGNIWEENNN